MGVCLAWPTSKYAVEQVEARKVAETVDWPRPKEKREWTAKRPPFDARKTALGRHSFTRALAPFCGIISSTCSDSPYKRE
jgi:hypothetical protein